MKQQHHVPQPHSQYQQQSQMSTQNQTQMMQNNIGLARSQSNLSHGGHSHSLAKHNVSMSNNVPPLSTESPLPPVVQRCLGDRSYEKRKNAALEIEALIKSLMEASNQPMIRSIITVLSKDFCLSMNANYRKGGLIGIAAVAIGLMMHTAPLYLNELLPPVLQCFDDPESRVRYYACESLYNIAKVARTSILARYFNPIFDGLCKLYADPDIDVKNGAGLLDRLVKDIVTESDSFQVDQFIPILQNYIRRTNPYIRQLLIGWITILDSVPDIDMIDYLPEFLDGLFNMLSDSNREIRQAADSALSEFLREVRESAVVEFGPIISILVTQCHSKNRLNRLTAISWLSNLIHHPYSGGDALLPFHADILKAIMRCLSDEEVEIRRVSEKTNLNLLQLVNKTSTAFQISPLLDTLQVELNDKNDVPTQMAALRWINMLLEKRPQSMNAFIASLLPVLLRTLSDPSDDVVLLNLQVLSRIALARNYFADSNVTATSMNPSPELNDESQKQNKENKKGHDNNGARESETLTYELLNKKKKQFQMVLDAILSLFASDPVLLEVRGSLIVRKLCVLLDAESVYITIANSLVSNESQDYSDRQTGGNIPSEDGRYSIEFIGKMVQTLNLILLSAAELHSLRTVLANTFVRTNTTTNKSKTNAAVNDLQTKQISLSKNVFPTLFHCWCHNPVSTFSLCLLAKEYDIAYALIRKFSELEVTVGFLMQVDKLVQLLESPVFINLRIQLLDVEAPHHDALLKSCYGLLMLLPQSDAFRTLNDRLATVCHLRDNLGIPSITSQMKMGGKNELKKLSLDSTKLLERFDHVIQLHSNFIKGAETESHLMTKLYATSDHAQNNDRNDQVNASFVSSPHLQGPGGQRVGIANDETNSNSVGRNRPTGMMMAHRGGNISPSTNINGGKAFLNMHGRGKSSYGGGYNDGGLTTNSAWRKET